MDFAHGIGRQGIEICADIFAGIGRTDINIVDVTEDRASCPMDEFGEKFGLVLDPATLMVTLRARTRPIDGRIHTDSETKVVTALLYLNGGWSDNGGQLRLLHGPDDIEDMAAEVPPLAGTLLAFRRTPHSWHGHKPFDGERPSGPTGCARAGVAHGGHPFGRRPFLRLHHTTCPASNRPLPH